MQEHLLADLDYINQKNLATLKRNNIETVYDLLYNYPTKYDDYTITSYHDAKCDETITIQALFSQERLLIV